MNAVSILLAGLLVANWLYTCFLDRRWTAERTRLLNAALANSPADFSIRQVAAGQDEPKRATPNKREPRPQPIGL